MVAAVEWQAPETMPSASPQATMRVPKKLGSASWSLACTHAVTESS